MIFQKVIKIFLLSSIAVSATSLSNGSSGVPGEYLLEFAGDAASFGRGGGSVALIDNPGSLYLNPAGLGKANYMEVLLCYARVFEEHNFFNGAFIYPFGKYGTVGFAITDLLSPEAIGYDEFGIATGENFRFNKNNFSISYGNTLLERFSLGLNIKIATETIGDYSGIGFGFDAGVAVKVKDWMQFGLTFMNIGGPKITLDQIADSYSPTLRFGVGSSLLKNTLSLNLDIFIEEIIQDKDASSSKSTIRPIRWTGGAEYWLIQYFALRAGVLGEADYNPETDIKLRTVSVGTAFRVRQFQVDYGVLIHTERDDFNSSPGHTFSLRYAFGKPIPKKEEELTKRLEEVESIEQVHKVQKLFIQGYYQKAFDLVTDLKKNMPNRKDVSQLYDDVREKLAFEKSEELNVSAKKAFDEGNYEEAEAIIAELFIIAPNDSAATILNQKLVLRKDNSGRIDKIKNLYAQKKYDAMMQELEVVLKIDSTHTVALEYQNKIIDYINNKKADEHYAQASKFYYENKDIEKANVELQQALNIAPNHEEAKSLYSKISKEVKEMYLKKVGSMVSSNDLNVENSDLKKLIELGEQDRLIEARKLLNGGRFKEALDQISSILKENPENEKAKALEKEILLSKNRSDSELLYSEALKLYNEKRFSIAEEKIILAINLDGNNVSLNELLEKIRLSLRKRNLEEAKDLISNGKIKDFNSAVTLIEGYLAVDPENEEANKMLADSKSKILIIEANSLIDSGEYEKANRAIQKALSVNPDSKEVKDAFKNIKEVIDLFVE